MSVVKTPTSSLTASELFVNKLWYRSKAKVKWLFCRSIQRGSTARSSPITKLPQELVEMVLSHFIYDTRTLLVCSMTCYSWYIATIRHLHHSLTTGNNWCYLRYNMNIYGYRFSWPNRLRKSYKLGLLPLTKRLRIRIGPDAKFTPEWLSGHTLRYFSALTNLQELGIDDLQVSSFMPNIRQCFGHFSPTLRFLALREPNGSCRQILYFIGLFPHLQDLRLHYLFPKDHQESTADTTLVPLSVPPLRGWLILTCFTREKLVEDMITLFGGLRFQYMDLFMVKCVRLLLDACAETLETLRLYPNDEYANSRASLRQFDLSRNRSLRTLETTAKSFTYPSGSDAAPDFFRAILSTVTPTTPLDVVVIYRDTDLGGEYCFRCTPHRVCFHHYPPTGPWLSHQPRLRVFCKMHSTRQFRLVLCADVLECMVEHALHVLECVVKMEGANGGFDHLPQKPLIICERRTLRAGANDAIVDRGSVYTIACAL